MILDDDIKINSRIIHEITNSRNIMEQIYQQRNNLEESAKRSCGVLILIDIIVMENDWPRTYVIEVYASADQVARFNPDSATFTRTYRGRDYGDINIGDEVLNEIYQEAIHRLDLYMCKYKLDPEKVFVSEAKPRKVL